MKAEELKTLKGDLVAICFEKLYEKQSALQLSLSEISESINTETKSSVGDKHETARARMQFEQDKLNGQLKEINNQINELQKIDASKTTNTVGTGSIIITNRGTFFISVALGRLNTPNHEVYAISQQSPLAKHIIGLQTGDEFEFLNSNNKIISVY